MVTSNSKYVQRVYRSYNFPGKDNTYTKFSPFRNNRNVQFSFHKCNILTYNVQKFPEVLHCIICVGKYHVRQ